MKTIQISVNKMAERDIEEPAWYAGSKSHTTDTSLESSESSESYSERSSLLPKDGDVVVADYKSTAVAIGESSQSQDTESEPLLGEDEAPPGNAFAVIGLLLIGKIALSNHKCLGLLTPDQECLLQTQTEHLYWRHMKPFLQNSTHSGLQVGYRRVFNSLSVLFSL